MSERNEKLEIIKKDTTYGRVVSYFSESARCDDNIRACYIIGSRAQTSSYPTPYSDLDMEIVARDRSVFTNNLSWVSGIAPNEFCYLQSPSDNCGIEIRVLFSKDYKLADIVFMNPHEFQKAYKNKQYRNGVFGRGVIVIEDKDKILSFQNCQWENVIPELTQVSLNQEYKYLLFHLVYAKKKIMAGELLTAKNTIDVGIRESLMKLIRWQEYTENPQKDLWHRARHFERWANPEHQILMEEACPGYNCEDLDESLNRIYHQAAFLTKSIAKNANFTLEYKGTLGNLFKSNKKKIIHQNLEIPVLSNTLERC